MNAVRLIHNLRVEKHVRGVPKELRKRLQINEHTRLGIINSTLKLFKQYMVFCSLST